MLHVAKGLDLEESLANVALLVLLIRSRRWFDAPGDPASLRLLSPGSALLTWLVAAVLLVPSGHGMDEIRILHVGVLALTVMTAIWLVHLWLRPWREPQAQSEDDHRRARRIVLEWGDDSLSFFALRRDRRYAFSRRDDALLAYRVVAGCALVSGDPVELPGAVPQGVWGVPAYFNSTVYYCDQGSTLKSFSIASGKLATAPVHTGASFTYPGVLPSVSANGTSNGIVWAIENTGAAVLHAFAANDLTQELYNSNQASNSRDHFGSGNKFITPMIADGKVFAATTNSVAVFGLLP